MVKLRNCFESKIQHKHQQFDEILTTFMKITRVNKLKNKTKFNTNINNVMKCCLPHENHSGAPDIHFFPVLHSTSLVCKRRCSVPRQIPSQFTKWRYLPMELCDVILRTNRVRCALIWKSFIYSTRRAFLEHAVVELVYKFDEKSYCECLKRWVDL